MGYGVKYHRPTPRQSIRWRPAPAIIGILPITGNCLMEAEQLNSISYKLDDLAQRAAELRRYL